jgi:hypothetical protein
MKNPTMLESMGMRRSLLDPIEIPFRADEEIGSDDGIRG